MNRRTAGGWAGACSYCRYGQDVAEDEDDAEVEDDNEVDCEDGAVGSNVLYETGHSRM